VGRGQALARRRSRDLDDWREHARRSFRLPGYDVDGASLNRAGETMSNRLRFDLAKGALIGVNDS